MKNKEQFNKIKQETFQEIKNEVKSLYGLSRKKEFEIVSNEIIKKIELNIIQPLEDIIEKIRIN